MISFVIPAHNEEAWIGRCILAISNVMAAVKESHEIIVVNDSSTDATAAIAAQSGARVILVSHRHISATRNSGAREARGDILFFVDADTLVNIETVRSALRALRGGAVGGGCVPRFDGRLPLWWKAVYPFAVAGIRLFRQPGGSCLFCTRSAFDVIGGFSEIHYAAEDALFASALKRHGRFVVVKEPILTSGRNLRARSFWSIARLMTRMALHGPNGFRDRQGLDLWYLPRREKSDSK